MATKSQKDAIKLYANLMEEIKIRLSCIEDALNSKFVMPGAVTREFCFLQLRMICELIALGCLTAHGDIEGTKELRKKYSANEIMARLEELHADFYPRIVVSNTSFPAQISLEDSHDGLTKDLLLKLNSQCGDVLHRGTIKKLLSAKTAIQNDFSDILKWRKQIIALLNYHAITLADTKTIILCVMANALDNNKVLVSIAEWRGDTKPDIGFQFLKP